MATKKRNGAGHEGIGRTVTMQDIARLSGVSQSTVSRVINGTATAVPIADATRERVLEAARRLGYTPNPLARALRGAKTMLLGVIARDISDPFFAPAVEAVSVAARERAYNVVLGSAHGRADEALELRTVLETRHCDGIIVLGDMRDQPRLLEGLAASAVPVVQLWLGGPLAGVHTVNVDNRAGVRMAVDHLAALGHRRFAFIGGEHVDGGEHGDGRERRAGFVERLAELAVPVDETNVVRAINEPGAGAEAFRTLAALTDPPTAVITSTDHLAIGALHAAYGLGMAIPERVSVVGFDDIPLSAYTAPPLTTVHNPITEMARLAVELAIDGDGDAGTRDHILAPTLTVRGTTGPPPS